MFSFGFTDDNGLIGSSLSLVFNSLFLMGFDASFSGVELGVLMIGEGEAIAERATKEASKDAGAEGSSGTKC